MKTLIILVALITLYSPALAGEYNSGTRANIGITVIADSLEYPEKKAETEIRGGAFWFTKGFKEAGLEGTIAFSQYTYKDSITLPNGKIFEGERELDSFAVRILKRFAMQTDADALDVYIQGKYLNHSIMEPYQKDLENGVSITPGLGYHFRVIGNEITGHIGASVPYMDTNKKNGVNGINWFASMELFPEEAFSFLLGVNGRDTTFIPSASSESYSQMTAQVVYHTTERLKLSVLGTLSSSLEEQKGHLALSVTLGK